uniref:Uncharacterized protein n=1 Tax=Anopheles culicifacies TaxID=139723 RepID=A0A182MHE5_9DIPT
MAMVVSGRAKAVIAAFVCFFLLGIVLVTGSTKGWFVPMRYNERVAARVQVSSKPHKPHNLPLCRVCVCTVRKDDGHDGQRTDAGQIKAKSGPKPSLPGLGQDLIKVSFGERVALLCVTESGFLPGTIL